MRAVGLDVHRDFCEVAIVAEGKLRSAGRIQTRPEALELFAQSLDARDWVALEVTGNAWAIARILEPHVARVIVVSPSDTGIRQARAKTDRLDARSLAKLLWAGELDGVWTPDERVRVMRRRLARRAQLVRARTRAKNEIHAMLMRRLKDRPPASDLFGIKGRQWLAEQQLAVDERETVDAGLRQVDFLDTEIAQVDQLIAADALNWPEVKRLMTVPGVNLIVAATFMAAVGDIRRFPRPAQAGRLPGPGPEGPPVRRRARQPRPHLKARLGRARHALVEASWSAVRSPARCRLLPARQSPARALDRDRRLGAQARVPVLVPALPRRGLRLRPTLADGQEVAPAGDHRRRAAPARQPRRLVDQHQHARTPNATSPAKPNTPTRRPSATAKPPARRRARARHRGAHHNSPRRAKPRGRPQAPDVCTSLRQSLAPTRTISHGGPPNKPP